MEPPFKALIIIGFFFFSAFPPSFRCKEDDNFTVCGRNLYSCGDLQNLSYPFSGGETRPWSCGLSGFELQCINNSYSTINIGQLGFRVLNVSQENNRMTLARLDLWDDLCSPKMVDTGSNDSLFPSYDRTVENLTLAYGCPKIPSFQKYLQSFSKEFSCGDGSNVYVKDSTLSPKQRYHIGLCEGGVFKVPISGAGMTEIESSGEGVVEKVLRDLLREGFYVNYVHFPLCETCEGSGGECGRNSTGEFLCFCSGGICARSIRGWQIKVIIGVIGAGGIMLLVICVAICRLRGKRLSIFQTKNDNRDLEAMIRSTYGHLTAKRYNFLAVKRMTKSFQHKLGKGGCGEVYKGNLPDGRPVAVKVLNTSKANEETFVNEVASISRTSHVNIVTLLGFCLEGCKRALIYEFMPNGSLEKFTYKDNLSRVAPQIEWAKLLEIAIGIARGLEYLHRGCNTKIIHLDIKPHNILLDEDFFPKISDFGLAKLSPKKESVISLKEARGTIGYVAPEVFNRNFGEVSSKSDVYSYGMMVLEMVGGRKNVKVEVSRTSEIYFPDWIYKHLELRSNLQFWSDMSSEENEIARKMIIVGLWCIQTKPSDRPSMSKVIEMLEKNLEALRIPPKPTFSSPISPERFPSKPVMAESSTSSLI